MQFLLECGLRSLDCDFVVGSITVWKAEVKVFDVQVHEREDKLQEINIPVTSVRGKKMLSQRTTAREATSKTESDSSDYLVLDRFPEHPGHFIACTQNSATNVSKPAGLIAG